MTIDIVTTTESVAAQDVLALYHDHEWWEDRADKDVERAIARTDVFIGLKDTETSRLVASARVLTDYTYYAAIYDVIVAEDRRGEGLGKQLLQELVEHPDLQDVDTLHLDCQVDLVPFYEKAGFEVRDLESDYETMVVRHREL